MSKITYSDKSDISTTSVAATNKIVAADMNEIKSVVNTNDDNIGDLTSLKTSSKTNIVSSINELVDGNTYTSGETKTNEKWKGSTIYRKTFTFQLGTQNSLDATHGISVSDTSKLWINAGKSFFYTSSISNPLGHYNSGTDFSRFYLTTTKIQGSFGSVYETISKTLEITVDYIKD